MNGITWFLIVRFFACLTGISACAGNDDGGNATSDDDATKQIRVACDGDSITEISAYPAGLQSLLGNGYLDGNFGHRGAVVAERFSDKTYLHQDEFNEAVAFLP